MTRTTLFDALGADGSPQQFFDDKTLVITAFDENSITLTDANGATVECLGRGLTRDGALPTGGRITAITLTSAEGDTLMTYEWTHVRAARLWTPEGAFVGVAQLNPPLIRNIHREIGSDLAESLADGRGNDTIRGRGGDDFIYSYHDDNTLTGGTGHDSFVFLSGIYDDIGHEVITDFHATAKTGDHDRLVIFESDYLAMTTRQVGKNVLITLKHGGELLLKHVDLATLDRHDFILI